jgi:hypothetical protein
MVTTGETDGWGQCHTVGRLASRTKFWRRQRFWKKNTLEAVNGLTSDDEDTVNGAFGPLEQPR